MIKKAPVFLSLILVLAVYGCVKETYNMNTLSKSASLSPTIVLSANGNVTLNDLVKANDTITYDQNKLLTFIFRKTSVVDIKLTDFAKGIIRTAEIKPGSIDLNIDKVLNGISGSFQILNPSIKFNYTNSFADPITINMDVTGIGKTGSVKLNQAPFMASVPNVPAQQIVNGSYLIDKTNSDIAQLISLPPKSIDYSGSAILDISGSYNLQASRLIGSLEVVIPMELRVANLQYADTVDNFLKDKSDNPVNPENFHFLSMKISAKNGFPFGVTMSVSTYNSATKTKLNTVIAGKIIEPAPVDASGKPNGFTESAPDIELTKDFFTSAGNSDKIIFTFTFVTTGNGGKDVKIYSDNSLSFNAALIMKPDVDLGNINIFN
jgi:hypothetical protein